MSNLIFLLKLLTRAKKCDILNFNDDDKEGHG